MQAVVFDVIRRYLEFRGYAVEHIQNFTDIDDKMIAAANRMGALHRRGLAAENTRLYFDEMDALNVLRAHVYPRATQEIPKILEMIETLIGKGFAYAVNGDVYFRVQAYGGYGKLSNRSLDSLIAGARVDVDESKEHPADFALWKSRKPGEPSWESPWGQGRPGWHIECSAMSIGYLGETIDIHGGGRDLVFPHHENELAQSEAFSDKRPFARFWVHNGSVRFGADKMSKSLGNIVPVGDALERFSPDALRLFFLRSHYRSPVEYRDENVQAQDRAVERLRNALRPGDGSGPGLDPDRYRGRFVEAMDGRHQHAPGAGRSLRPRAGHQPRPGGGSQRRAGPGHSQGAGRRPRARSHLERTSSRGQRRPLRRYPGRGTLRAARRAPVLGWPIGFAADSKRGESSWRTSRTAQSGGLKAARSPSRSVSTPR